MSMFVFMRIQICILSVLILGGVAAAALSCKTADSRLEAIYESMTPEQRVGQLFFLVFDGTALNDAMRGWIEKRGIGGIALFAKNASTEAGLVALSASLHSLAAAQKPAVPLFIATDHEPGGFMAIRIGHTFNNQRSIFRDEGIEGLVQTYKALSEDLKRWGFNMNFAPVLDVARPGGASVFDYRCLSDDPHAVAAAGQRIIRTSLEYGIIPVAKHFPGHGDTTVDSHHYLPRIEKSREAFNAVELPPFKAAIEAGIPAIMPAHILFPAIDASLPATLSARHLTGLLREELGFEGITISDDLAMGAIKNHHDLVEACRQAIVAGMDMLLITRRFPGSASPEEVHRKLVEWIQQDEEGAAHVKAAVLRILRIKAQHLGL